MFGLWRQVCDKLASSWRVPVEVLGFLKRVRARMLQGLASVFKYSRGIEGLVECCQCTTRTWTQRGFCDCATEKSFKKSLCTFCLFGGDLLGAITGWASSQYTARGTWRRGH
jgi:hypothetical protein